TKSSTKILGTQAGSFSTNSIVAPFLDTGKPFS
ncbi:MAG: hypothetical protein ACI849_001342, partial [Patiriisocius sp.]